MQIAYTKATLDNGLDVIVHEDHDLPIVAVNVWYHVGSKNERPGRTGFAHLFEHLMFEGSEHHDRGYFPPLQEAGASVNGSTNADRTNYWEVVPPGALDLALWMESDRMGYLLPALTRRKFENQRDVVLNERRQNYENRPYGRVGMALASALYRPDHPYHWLTIGQAADLTAARLEDAHAFFTSYYHPGNASVALAGDVEAGLAIELVRRYFDEIPSGPDVAPVRVAPPRLETEIRGVLADQVEFPRLYLAWHSPALFAPFDAELDLAGDLLANSKTSRLYRTLVYERRVALDVAAFQSSREMSGFFQVVATAAPGRTLVEIDAAITEEIDRMATDGPTDDELERGQAQAEGQFVYRLQTVGGFNGKSDQLNAYHTFVGDPGAFGRDLQRYLDATRESIRSAVETTLRVAPRVALSVVPRDGSALALAGSVPAEVS
jgi:zinc protease